MKKKKIYKNNFKYFFRFMNSNIISISHFQMEKKFLFQNIFLIIRALGRSKGWGGGS